MLACLPSMQFEYSRCHCNLATPMQTLIVMFYISSGKSYIHHLDNLMTQPEGRIKLKYHVVSKIYFSYDMDILC